ncbi:PQQ-binding-like beta-propeller repeat protein [Desulfurobacterium atlanticum]|uniref:Outer membrane protein assembly factor BamB, contains PQQ-like beta-propeller repeat n=1 Tax=Desulfurobacterium atlanticum TaxID=240169 RepID=A0A239A1B2_9BACT|nr:PQQ-binding-like beta-propeller repeat protein [Desulfurobacterium atlanticum]SNR89447.1 Outer membrane protein assembly factor BamB, contains PQQ-like beta-propeller repeat [Desulfurobacterium atlanticum]
MKPLSEEILKAIENKKEKIALKEGSYKLDGLIKLKSSLKIKGEGKDKTVIEIDILFSGNHQVEIQDTTLKVRRFISNKNIRTENADFICDETITSIATSVEEFKKLLKEKTDQIWLTEGIFKVDKLYIRSNLIGEGKDKTKIVAEESVVENVTLESLTLEAETFTEKEKFKSKDINLAFRTLLIKKDFLEKEVDDRFLKHLKVDKDGTLYASDGYFLYALNKAKTLKWKFPLEHINSSFKVKYPENLKVLLKIVFKECKSFSKRKLEELTKKILPDEKDSLESIIGDVFASKNTEHIKYLFKRLKQHNFYELEISKIFDWETCFKDKARISIGDDGTIYIFPSSYAFAINPDGSPKWKNNRELLRDFFFYIVTKDTIYYSSRFLQTLALNLDGSIKWKFKHDKDEEIRKLEIDSEGTLYVVTETLLYAVNPDGSLKWKFSPQFQEPEFHISFTGDQIISEDIIFDFKILEKDKKKTIYICTRKFLYSIDSTGRVNWQFKIENGKLPTKLEIDRKNNTVYLLSFNDGIYALNFDGLLKWRFKEESSKSNYFGTSWEYMLLGNDGTVYTTDTLSVYSIDSEGFVKWKFSPGKEDSIERIGKIEFKDDGKLFVLTNDKLYLLKNDGHVKWEFQPSIKEHEYLQNLTILNKDAVAVLIKKANESSYLSESFDSFSSYVIYTDTDF